MTGEAPVQSPGWGEVLTRGEAPGWGDIGRATSEQAQGVLEHAKYQGIAAAKELGDGFQNVANLLYKSGAGIGSMVQGQSFGQGWEGANRTFQQRYGDENPSILDLFGDDESGLSAGRAADQLIERRLGRGASFGRAVGAVGAFMLPGAPVGRAASVAAKPLGEVAERVLAKVATKRAGLNDEIARGLLDNGNVWGYLAQNPAVGNKLKLLDSAIRATGRNAQDLMSTGAANIAQSYALAPDDHRLQGAMVAGAMTPFVLPVARLGQRLGQAVMEGAIRGESAEIARAAFSRFQAGEMGLKELRGVLADQVGMGRNAASALLSGAFEGTAFMGLDPQVWPMLGKAMQGDEEAIGNLLGMSLGSVAGVAGMKMAMPGMAGQEVPFFRSSHPDLNRLQTYLEAHANKLASERMAAEPVKVVEGRDPSEVAEQDAREQMAEAQQGAEIPLILPETQADVRARYGWAESHAQPLLRGNWQPEFLGEGTDVWMRFDRDHSVQLSGTAISPTLTVTPKVEGILRRFGRAPEDGPNRVVTSPDRIELSGPLAQKALDDLGLVGVLRRMQGDDQFARMGYREVQPGLWADDAGNFHAAQLDGSTATRDLEGNLVSRDDIRVVGRDTPPVWDGPAAQALAEWVTTKQALSPDPVVDSLILQAIETARYGTSRGAQELRTMLDNTDPQQLLALLGPGSDREVAFLIGSLAGGNGNAMSVHGELGNVHQHKAGKAQQGAQTDTADVQMDKDRAEFLEAMEERTLVDLLAEGPKPDAPTEAATGAMGGQELSKVVKGSVKRLEPARDYIFENQAQVLEKAAPGSDVPHRARRAMAERAELVGLTRDTFRGAEKAMKSKEGKVAVRGKTPVPNLSPDEGTVRAWRRLADAEVRPSNEAEREILAGFQRTSGTLWSKSIEVGMTRNERTPEGMRTVPLGKRDKAVTQRVPGDDSKKVHDNKALRRAWFETLVRANPEQQIRDAETKEMRKLTADDLEAEWNDDRIRDVDNLENEAAMEFQRRFRNAPDEWKAPDGKVYTMFETDPFETMKRVTEHQASRISHVRQFGQDFAADQRAVMAKDETLPPAVRANLERGGTEKALRDLQAELNKREDQSRNEAFLTYGKQLLGRTQGVEPIKPNMAARLLRGFTSLSSAVMAAPSFVLDIPEPLTRLPAYTGLRSALKAIGQVVRHPIEMVRQYETLGAIDRQIGDHVLTEAKGWPQKAADIAGWIASKSERVKGAIAAAAADDVIARARRGEATLNDLQVAQDILSLSPEDMLSIREGKVSDALASQWRRELVQLVTSRGRPAEGSAMAASPNVKAFIRFTQFATKRANSLLRTVASVKIAGERHGWNSREAAMAGARLVAVLTGMGVGGLLGTAIGKTLVGMFAGDPWDEGLGKFGEKLLSSPFSAIGEAYSQQLVGGPFSQLARAAGNPESGQDVANLTVPTSLLYAGGKALNSAWSRAMAMMTGAAVKGDGWTLYSLGKDLGLIPFRQHLGNAAALAFTSNSQARLDANYVREWKREQGMRPVFGDRDKPQAFYDAIAQIEAATEQPGATRDSALSAAMDAIRTALSLAPEESVAGAIDGHQLVRDLSPEDRSKLEERASDARMTRIYQHDALLRELAREVRRMEGTNPTEWEADLEAVAQSAALGAGDRWGQLADRALDETAQRVANREAFGDQVMDVAEKMALHPDQLESLFSKQQLRMIQNPRIDGQTRARRIAAILRTRVQERVEKIRKEQRGR